jgi:hypothetical protein
VELLNYIIGPSLSWTRFGISQNPMAWQIGIAVQGAEVCVHPQLKSSSQMKYLGET